MTTAATRIRQFRVHAGPSGHHPAQIIEEASFEAAAVAYAEDFDPPIDGEPEVRVIVRELATGHEHCFLIDLVSGETAACG